MCPGYIHPIESMYLCLYAPVLDSGDYVYVLLSITQIQTVEVAGSQRFPKPFNWRRVTGPIQTRSRFQPSFLCAINYKSYMALVFDSMLGYMSHMDNKLCFHQ